MTDSPERVSIETQPPSQAVLEALQELIPGAVSDGVIDAERIGEAAGLPVAGIKDGAERFGLMWAGKGKAVEALQAPSMAALAPDMENSINWDTAENVFIEGDNLEVLKLLQKAYNDQVKLIYIDPPYNTGNDFVYNDDFSQPIKHYLEVTGQVDGEGNRLVANTEVSGRKHSNWLSMMYPRLVFARNVLTDDGLICISIDDVEHANLVEIVKEIFGEENYLGSVARVQKKTSNKGTHFAPSKDYVVMAARSAVALAPFMDDISDEYRAKFAEKDDRGNFATVGLYQAALDPMRGCSNQRYWILCPDGTYVIPPGKTFPELVEDASNRHPESGNDKVWRWSYATYLEKKDLLVFKETKTSPLLNPSGTQSRWNVYTKYYLEDRVKDGIRPRDFLDGFPNEMGTKALKNLGMEGLFDFPKPVELIQKFLTWVHDDSALVLDFFAGSGTTGHAVLEQNSVDFGTRRFILVTLPEPTAENSKARDVGIDTVSEITRMRLKKVAEKYGPNGSTGLRCLNLTRSTFVTTNLAEQGALELIAETIDPSATEDAIATECLLKNGVRLDKSWSRIELEGASAVVSDGVCVVLAREINDDIVEAAKVLEDAHTVIFLEDAFAGRDAIKANAVLGFKQANKTMKTV
jgi:adenine-specific DNA-methyltransferase